MDDREFLKVFATLYSQVCTTQIDSTPKNDQFICKYFISSGFNERELYG